MRRGRTGLIGWHMRLLLFGDITGDRILRKEGVGTSVSGEKSLLSFFITKYFVFRSLSMVYTPIIWCHSSSRLRALAVGSVGLSLGLVALISSCFWPLFFS